jgi:hypothetical protein
MSDSRRALITFAISFALLAGTLVVLNAGTMFTVAWEERGDEALNALDIADAGDFRQLHGNYSRWKFRHPGPVFFYAYALGERVFHRWTGLVPAPMNAHLLTGLLVQAAFVSAALAVAATWARGWLLIPVSLGLLVPLFAAANKFAQSQLALLSIWPPDVLVGPFLCLVVACASVAAGRVRHMPVAVLAGCFLVHAHVAQPLFAGVLFAGSCAIAATPLRFRMRRWRRFLRRNWAALAVSAAMVLLFLAPVVIDTFHGEASNLTRVIEHLRTSKGDRKTPGQAIQYVMAMFDYARLGGYTFPSDTATWREVLLARPAVMITWAVLLAGLPLWWLMQRRTARRKFALVLLLACAVVLVLSVVWGMLQNGPMFYFNAHYLVGLHAALLVALALAVDTGAGGRIRPAAGVAFALVAVMAVILLRPAFLTGGHHETYRETVDRAFLSDPAPKLPKLLHFEHALWPEAATVAVYLRRAGVPFYVQPGYGFMFDMNREYPEDVFGDGGSRYSLWLVAKRAPDGVEGLPLDEGIVLAVPGPRFGAIRGRVLRLDGSAPVGARVRTHDGLAASVDETGSYTLYVPVLWSGWMCAEGHGIPEPEMVHQGPVEGEATGVDFTVYPPRISGRVTTATGEPVAGAEVANSGGGITTTDADGLYSMYVDLDWTGHIEVRGHMDATPPRREYANLRAHQADQDFVLWR